LNIGTRARIDTGRLSVYLDPPSRQVRHAASCDARLVGRLRDAEDFDTISTEQLQVHVRG